MRRKFEQQEIRAAVQQRLKDDWSPEQIEGRTKRQCADDPQCWISRQTIYEFDSSRRPWPPAEETLASSSDAEAS
jgi:IS30 family transposase